MGRIGQKERICLFVAALTFLSLLQFNLDWWDRWRDQTNPLGFLDAIRDVMGQGPLFFFAVVVAVATFFEVRDHDSLWSNSVARRLSYGCIFPIVAMVFAYFPVRHGAAPPDNLYIAVQGGSALLAATIAAAVKYMAYGNETATPNGA